MAGVEPNEEQTVKKGAGPSEPNEEHTGEGGWAGVTLQPPTQVAFWGFVISQSDNHPLNNLAKFGCILDMKVWKKKNT